MERKLIGFFDSGVGGISVLACAKRFVKNADYIFYADTDNVPYGTKTADEIISYADEAIRCLIDHGVDAVVIACNTATSVAAEVMRERYALPIIGLEPALKPAVGHHPGGKVLVCATTVTIAGEKLHSLIESTDSHPVLYALPELVTFAENGVFDKETVSSYLRGTIPNADAYDAVVLGCTHFTYFREAFADTFKNAEIVDGNVGAVKRLAYLLDIPFTNDASADEAKTMFLRSGREITDERELNSFSAYERRMTDYYSKY